MHFRSLQTRFILAGGLLVTTTVACGVWSIITFARLSAVVGTTLRDSQEVLDLTATLATALEREDDALLLSLTGEVDRALRDLRARRQTFDGAYARLGELLHDQEAREAATSLREHTEAYRVKGDALLAAAGQPGARDLYHERVNPALRQAVAGCARLRELNFHAMQRAALQARDDTNRATGIVAGILAASLVLSTLVAVRLARSIVGPVRALTESVEAIRNDNFDRRVQVESADELGRLADGFNRMAETLADYRHSSLGELLLAKTTLESTLAALPDAVIVVDPEGEIVSKNPLAMHILKALGGAEAGRVQDLPIPPDTLSAVHGTLRGERTRQSRPGLSQALSVSFDGRPLKLLVIVAPIPEFLPKRCGAVIVLADVTDFARLDELRSELVAVASHELKTPLTTLRVNLMLLEEGAENLTPRQREILATAALGGEELAATIDELLDLTRIEAGQLRLVQERVDVYGVIDQGVRSLRPRFEDAEIALRVAKEAPEAAVRGDAARLRIVFANLLTNALKYTPRAGEVLLRVAAVANANSADPLLLQIEVTDTGPGIPAEFRERVFEKFFRVEHHRAGPPEGVRGTGIGLYLCRQIVEAHGGTIRCESGDHGRGARLVIHLLTVGEQGGPSIS
jgi:NtrC-family two-component system sensor histidine kinase KinB